MTDEELARVWGGKDPGYRPWDNAFGRAGPGTGWNWLGNYYTPEALAHDQKVRDGLAKGDNLFMAHVEAAPQLPGAVWSYFRARIHPGPDDMQLPPAQGGW